MLALKWRKQIYTTQFFQTASDHLLRSLLTDLGHNQDTEHDSKKSLKMSSSFCSHSELLQLFPAMRNSYSQNRPPHLRPEPVFSDKIRQQVKLCVLL